MKVKSSPFVYFIILFLFALDEYCVSTQMTTWHALAPQSCLISQSATEPGERLSGIGLTSEQHDAVNQTIREFFTDPTKSSRIKILTPKDKIYQQLDPEKLLMMNSVPIFVFEGFLSRIKELCKERGIKPPIDLISHPGRKLRRVYIDADKINYLLQQGAPFHVAWARHELAHVQYPNENETEIQERAPLPSSLSQRLGLLMKQRGISSEKLAQKTGVGRRTIEKTESSETIPHGSTLGKIALAFGVSITDLLGEEPPNLEREKGSSSIDEKVRKRRIENGLTRRALGTLAGVAIQTIYYIESGRIKPKQETLEKIEKALAAYETTPKKWEHRPFKDFLQRLIALRKISLEELSIKAGLCTGTIENALGGKKCSILTQRKILQAFGIPLDRDPSFLKLPPGRRLQSIRIESGFSPSKLGKKSEVPVAQIISFERGEAILSKDQLERIAKCLAIPKDVLSDSAAITTTSHSFGTVAAPTTVTMSPPVSTKPRELDHSLLNFLAPLPVGARIQTIRIRFGLSIKELAQKTSVKRDTIEKIESGETKPHGSTLGKIARALEVSTTVLWGNPSVPESEESLLSPGERIKRRRIENGMTTRELATLARVSEQIICKIEGGYQATPKTIGKLEEAFCLSSAFEESL